MRSFTPPMRGVFLLVTFVAFLLPVSLAAPVSAQVRIPAEALSGEENLQSVFAQGKLLEQQQRWGEALGHYEEALRDFPGRQDLQQRLTLARIHFDLSRRYNDSSFIAAIQQIDERKALDVYSEVLLKIQAHYVDSPNWHQLFRQGTTQVDVALIDRAFLDQNLHGVMQDHVEAFRRELHQLVRSKVARDRYEARQHVSSVARYASQRLGVTPQAVIMEYACGAIGALDTYSSFLTGDQLDDVMSQIDGNFVGLGIELKADDQSLLIVSVIPGGPAERGGLHAGDRIVRVEDALTADISTDAAADMLKGPEGSIARLTIVTPQNTTRQMQIRRERVEVPSVDDIKIIDPQYGIAYLKLTCFQKTTLRDFDAALWNLHHQGMKSLIIDVRGNPGGLLSASVEVADKFVSSGNIVSTRGRSSREDFDYKAHNSGTWRVPLIVLIDGDSASASEIFAAAIRDHRRGTVVGQQSYGKGSVQGIFPLNVAKAGVRLTTAKFYSPHGLPISKRGVQPDVAVRSAAKITDQGSNLINSDNDSVLEAGLQVARQQLSRR